LYRAAAGRRTILSIPAASIRHGAGGADGPSLSYESW
jgi:hypothetical protein